VQVKVLGCPGKRKKVPVAPYSSENRYKEESKLGEGMQKFKKGIVEQLEGEPS